MINKRKITSIMILVTLLVSTFANVFFFGPLAIIDRVNASNISYDLDNSTKLNVSVQGPFPRILWYDFQVVSGATWTSKLNQQIDIDNTTRCRFVVNVSSDYGWDNITYINITGWMDNGSEKTAYNQSGNQGGNRNFKLMYNNSAVGAARYRILWPRNMSGMTKKAFTDATRRDPGDAIGSTCENHNLTFEFVPGYQFRYAPGDGSWGSGRHLNQSSVYENGTWWWSLNDLGSWNFNITVENDVSIYGRTGYSTWAVDEFGVYSYSAITSAGSPKINGIPGENASATSAITITTRSNGNYSLSVNLSNLTHIVTTGYTISNESVWIFGGNMSEADVGAQNFTAHKTDPKRAIYLYGASDQYRPHEANGTQKTTGTNTSGTATESHKVVYKCLIPLGSMAGTYRSTIRYTLRTQQ